MSGLLRRIKRSRAADAGETHAEGQAAGPEGAPTTAETAKLPAAATAPAIKADPAVPAGLDPAEPVASPAGRRGRLRRRLRYLRRARELMLRDLGGLLYEVHRTGGGDVSAHTAVIGGKVERLARLDAEAAAIETALGAPRSEAVVFEPGIGGTCAVCGELYGSAARFCSHCGTPTGATAAPREVPAMPKAPAAADAGDERQASANEAGQVAPTGHDRSVRDARGRTGGESREPRPAGDQTRELDASRDASPEPKPVDGASGEAGGDETRKPLSSLPNGRPGDHGTSGLSSGDPLAARERS